MFLSTASVRSAVRFGCWSGGRRRLFPVRSAHAVSQRDAKRKTHGLFVLFVRSVPFRSVPFRSLGQGRADSIVTADAVYERMFATVDGDGSGAISAKEFAAALRKLGQEMTVDDVMEVTKDVDNDGSGQLELVEVRLWHRYFRACTTHAQLDARPRRLSSHIH